MVNPKCLVPGAVLPSAAPVALYTPPTGQKARITTFSITETGNTSQTVTIYRVPQGGAPTPGNIVLNAEPLTPKQTRYFPSMRHVLEAGDTLYGSSSAGAVTLTVSGYEFVVQQ